MDLTVGKIEEILRGYNKDTIVHTGCNCCNRSGSGEGLLQLVDKTNQTYGYIELNLNGTHESKIELSIDKEQFYIRELEKKNIEIQKLKSKLKIYEDTIESIERCIRINDKRVKWEIENV